MLNFSISNLLIVIALLAMSLNFLLQDRDKQIQKSAILLEQEKSLVREQLVAFSLPITKEELEVSAQRYRNHKK